MSGRQGGVSEETSLACERKGGVRARIVPMIGEEPMESADSKAAPREGWAGRWMREERIGPQRAPAMPTWATQGAEGGSELPGSRPEVSMQTERMVSATGNNVKERPQHRSTRAAAVFARL